jgi:hypothetical protein
VRKGGWTVFLAHCERGSLDMSLALDLDGKIAGLKFTPHVTTKPEPQKRQTELSEGTERYPKMANQLVELLNAGNYAGIQTHFNKEMDAALPLDKSSAFFKELTQQMGKIQKLGEPRALGETMVFRAMCEKGTLDMQLALDRGGKIAGLTFTPSADSPDPAPQKH